MTVAPLETWCKPYHEGACSEPFRVVDNSGSVWIAECPGCGGEVGVPARRLDAGIRRETWLARANLQPRFDGQRFVRDSENEPVLKALRQWLSSSTHGGPGALLPAPALFGSPGRGKTHLLSEICRRVIVECELPAFYISTAQLLRDLQQFEDRVECGRVWERATSVPVLALDDLGAENSSDWRLEQLAQLMDRRYGQELPVVLATNFPPSQWEQILDDRTVSRLRQMTFALELRGPDRRLTSQIETKGG